MASMFAISQGRLAHTVFGGETQARKSCKSAGLYLSAWLTEGRPRSSRLYCTKASFAAKAAGVGEPARSSSIAPFRLCGG